VRGKVDERRARRLSRSLAPLVSEGRRREVLALAEQSPEEAAEIAEMAIVKRGDFAPTDRAAPLSARVLVWNMERGRAPDDWVEIAAVREADILLLCEIDDGMARSGNLDIAAELARRLRMNYAFVPNYFELTRGTRWERIATRGRTNLRGLHGNAILSRWPLHDVRRIPLPVEFDWFRHYECRIGTRVALRATLETHGQPVTVAVAHLEALAAPRQRARQMRALLENLADAPRAIVGGDFNTLGVAPSWRAGIRLVRERARDARRLTGSIILLEPLFEAARHAGFSWEELNTPSATWHFNQFLPASLRAKLDWLFARGLMAEPGSAAVIAARREVSAASRLSDHDGLAVNVRL
jgi:endonuclease/exonuclease/phosphatase family metal-dependent hydrolase